MTAKTDQQSMTSSAAHGQLSNSIVISTIFVLCAALSYFNWVMPVSFMGGGGYIFALIQIVLFVSFLSFSWEFLKNRVTSDMPQLVLVFIGVVYAALIFIGATPIALFLTLAAGAWYLFRKIALKTTGLRLGDLTTALLVSLLFLALIPKDTVISYGQSLLSLFDMFSSTGKLDDWQYHHTLVGSILNYGYPSTGLHGIQLERYHVGGHYALAGFYRVFNLDSFISPRMTSPFFLISLLVVSVAFAAFIAMGAMRRNNVGVSFSASPLVIIGLPIIVTFVLFQIITQISPQTTFHFFVLSNGVAIPLMGIGVAALYAYLCKNNDSPMKINRTLLAALYVILFICSFTKISSGLVFYTATATFLAWHLILALFQKGLSLKSSLLSTLAWILGGGFILLLAYVFVSVIKTESSLFDPKMISYLYEKTSYYIFLGLKVAAINAVIWMLCILLYRRLSIVRALGILWLSFCGIAATSLLMVTTILTNYNDVAYMHISAIQLNIFTILVAGTLIAFWVIRQLEKIVKMPTLPRAYRSGILGLFIIVMVGLFSKGFYGKASVADPYLQGQMCNQMKFADCMTTEVKGKADVFAKLSQQGDISKIISDVTTSFDDIKDKSDIVIVVDKASGFFTNPTSGRWKEVPCYRKNWPVYLATGSAFYNGFPRGALEDQLCAFPHGGYDYLWTRYGHAAYIDDGAEARSYSEEEANALCETEALRKKHIAFFDKDLTLKRINCQS